MLENAAYSDQYQNGFKQYEALFLDENKKEVETIILSDEYKIRKTNYAGRVSDRNLDGHSCILFDKEDNVIHSWKSFDSDADFEKIITHQNKNNYLVYRQELYGYTVFDLTNRKEFQYYPQCVLDGREYFIWTDIHYNPLNNLLAVSGCIWGAPYSTLLVDFSNPMATPKFQIDVIDCLPGDYDVYDNADFILWDKCNLILNCYNVKAKLEEKIILTEDIYRLKINALQ